MVPPIQQNGFYPDIIFEILLFLNRRTIALLHETCSRMQILVERYFPCNPYLAVDLFSCTVL